MERKKKLALMIGIPVAVFLIFCFAVLLFYHPEAASADKARQSGTEPILNPSAPVSDTLSPSALPSPAPPSEEASPSLEESVSTDNEETEKAPEEPVPVKLSEDDIVHITASGRKYHRAGCSALSKSDTEISLGDALRKGYESCSLCKPGSLPITPAPSPASAPSQKLSPTPAPAPAPESSPSSASAATPPPSFEPTSALPSQNPEEPSPGADEDDIVYITASGGKYHTATCRYLKKSATEITLSQAIADGYKPCSVCKPPG